MRNVWIDGLLFGLGFLMGVAATMTINLLCSAILDTVKLVRDIRKSFAARKS